MSSNSIELAGVVFVRFVTTQDGVCRVFVTDKAKNYNTASVGLFDLRTGDMAFAKSTARIDTKKAKLGMFVEAKGTPGSLLDQPDYGWQLHEFPLFNKIITDTHVRTEKGQKVYQVVDAGLTDAQIRMQQVKFSERFPEHMERLKKKYAEKTAAGTYIPIQERLAGNQVQSSVSAVDVSLPFTADDLINASPRNLQTWCKELGLDYPGNKENAKRILLKMLG